MKNNERNREEHFKLTIADWNDGIWGNRDLFFKNLNDAKLAAKKARGKYKIYNHKGHLVHADKNTEHNNDPYA